MQSLLISRRNFAAGLLAAAALPSVAFAKTALDWGPVEALARAYVAQRRVPGLALCVTRSGRPIFARGFGSANLEADAAMDARSVFRIGSMTKQFTAVAILLLAEQGKLALDDPLSRFLPDFPRAADLSLRRMLTHTAGLGNYTAAYSQDELLQVLRIDRNAEKLTEFLRSSGKPQIAEPGTCWSYSNTGYVLLGIVVEKASGIAYERFLAERLFAPLHLKDTAVDDAADVVRRRVSGYVRVPGGATDLVNAPFISMTVPGGAGNLRSTALDLCAWETALLDGRVLAPASLKAMTTPAVLNDGTLPLGPPRPDGSRVEMRYGMGVFLNAKRGRPTVSHGGSIPGFSTQLTGFPDQRLTIATLTNMEAAFADVDALERAVLDVLFPA